MALQPYSSASRRVTIGLWTFDSHTCYEFSLPSIYERIGLTKEEIATHIHGWCESPYSPYDHRRNLFGMEYATYHSTKFIIPPRKIGECTFKECIYGWVMLHPHAPASPY